MEINSRKTFQYQTLSATSNHPIRMLKLLPDSTFEGSIRCEVLHTSLGQHPDFEALSYTWGDAKDTVSISLNDQSFTITRNLDSTLRHLRYADTSRVLWVDALCINQGDIPERNSQVAHMREIYNVGGAKSVVAWLGEAGNARLALEFCKRLAEEEPVFATLPGYEDEWEACRELFSRPWWSRAWILQEVIHTNEVFVHIGDLVPISIEEICEAFSTYTYLLDTRKRLRWLLSAGDERQLRKSILPQGRDWSSWIRSQIHVMETPLQIQDLRSEGCSETLPGLVFKFRNHEATDFRDKIYAFLGLAERGPIWHKISIDYTLSKRTLYTTVARAFISNSLIPLLLVESHNRPVVRDQELPSWVTDYTIKQGLVARAHISCVSSFHADAGFPSTELEPRFLDAKDSEVLVLRGIYVAVITGVYESRITNDEDIQGDDYLKLIRHDENEEMRHHQFSSDPPSPWQAEDPQTGAPLISHCNTSWGPIFCEVGDIIIVAAGSRIPFVLREFEPGKYMFVGACWMIESEIQDNSLSNEEPGFSRVMYGRACEGLPNDFEAELFCIY